MPAQYPGNAITKAARAASGGGFESAIGATGGGATIGTPALRAELLDSDLNQGSRLRITSDGTYVLGTKPEGPAILHDFGHTAFERGVENPFNASLADGVEFANTEADRIYQAVRTGGAPSVLISGAEAARHAHASRAYKLFGNYGRIEKPQEFLRNGKNAGHRTMYFAVWVKYKENSHLMRAVSDETTTGTFIEDEVLSTNNGEFIGRYSYFDNDAFANLKHHLVIENSRVPADSELYGKTLTGQSSGATIVFPNSENWRTAYTTVSGTEYPFIRIRGPKLGRWWDNPDGNTSGGNLDYVRCSIAVDDGYISTELHGRPVNFYTGAFQPPGEWVLFELEFDLRTNGFFRHRFNEVLREETTFAGPIGDPNYSPELSQFGTDGGWTRRQEVTIGEVYFDYTQHRVYLANAANWADITHRELQRLIAWDGNVDIALHYGALTSGWLYLVGGDGQPINTVGLEVV